jgi:hypothetical protein
MTNQPMPKGSKFHDASDLRCDRHRDAVQRKGIKPMANRTCPVCNPEVPHDAAPQMAKA